MITVRRVISAEFQYQLAVTRVFEEGEELILDEDDESVSHIPIPYHLLSHSYSLIAEQERSFLIDEALQFRLGAFEGQGTFQWQDLEEDEDDSYEFVATGADAPALSAFEMAVYSAMYERKNGRSSMGVAPAELRKFAYVQFNRHFPIYLYLFGPLFDLFSIASLPSATTTKGDKSGEIADLSSTLEKLSMGPIHPDKPRVITEPAILYLWNMAEESYHKQGDVEASIIEMGPFLCAYVCSLCWSFPLFSLNRLVTYPWVWP